jgi:SIR2-like domain
MRTPPAFLFGAGASIPAGFPSTAELTDKVLSGDGFVRHTDETYYLGDHGNAHGSYSEYVPTISMVLCTLKNRIDPFLMQRRGSPANYEDLAYVLGQIADSEYGEIENPAIAPFLEGIEAELTSEIQKLSPRIDALGGLAQEAANFVSDVVFRMLDKPAQTFDHLAATLEVIGSSPGKEPLIATLNHDNHLECFLQSRFGHLNDGFANEVNDIRYWRGYQTSQADKRISLYKLHGSVDWFTFGPDNGRSFYEHRVGVYRGGDVWHTTSPDGRPQTPLLGRPNLIVGTFNKFTLYTSAMVAEIHHAWRSALRASSRLVICGYGFGDKGINAQIIDWVYGDKDRRVLVISPNIDGLRARSRGAISNKWETWLNDDVMETIESKLEDVSFNQFENFFK